MVANGNAKLVSATPVIDTNIYASGDQLGGLMVFENTVDEQSGTGTIMSVSILDGDSQNAAIDILFFDAIPTITSSDNAALDISDSEMASKFLGAVSFAASDYKSLAANSYATSRTVGLFLRSTTRSVTNLTGTNVYAVLQSRGTPTFSGAGKLTVKLGILQD